jgi:hypothetical protein
MWLAQTNFAAASDKSNLLAAVHLDFVALALLLQGFGEHELTHPIDALVLVLDSEMVRLAGHSFPASSRGSGGMGASASLAVGHELESKRGDVSGCFAVGLDVQAFERGA